MEISFLQSSQLLQELKWNLERAKSFRAAAAFLKKSGFYEIKTGLEVLLRKPTGQAELVIGISSYGITDWDVLRELQRMKEEFSNLSVRYYNNERFHPKLFIFELALGKTCLIVGSSNLTGGGVRNNIEANVCLTGANSDDVFEDASEFFQNIFHGGEMLKDETVEEYRSYTAKQSKAGQRRKLNIAKTPLVPMAERGSEILVPRISSRALEGKAFWKVAPGKQAAEWPLWKKEIQIDRDGVMRGTVSIGWDFDMTRLPFDDEAQLVKVVQRKLAQLDDPSDPLYVATQAKLFCRNIRKGHIIVAYSKRQIHGIAQVSDDTPYFCRDSETYPNKRNVRWLTLRAWMPKERFRSVLRHPQDTIHQIEDVSTINMLCEELARTHERS